MIEIVPAEDSCIILDGIHHVQRTSYPCELWEDFSETLRHGLSIIAVCNDEIVGYGIIEPFRGKPPKLYTIGEPDAESNVLKDRVCGFTGEPRFPKIFIHDVAVNPLFRGLGIGAEIVNYVLDKLNMRKPSTDGVNGFKGETSVPSRFPISLISLRERIGFWEKFGFTKTESFKDVCEASYPPGAVYMVL